MSKASLSKLPRIRKNHAKLSENFNMTVYSFVLSTNGQLAEWSKAYAWNAYIGQPI